MTQDMLAIEVMPLSNEDLGKVIRPVTVIEASDKRPSTIEEAFQAHYHDLIAFLLKQTGSANEAEDIVQETFARLMHRKVNMAEIKNAKTYLMQVAKNILIDEYRKQNTRKKDSHVSIDGEQEAGLTEISTAPHLLDQYERTLDVLKKALAELTPRTREVFMLSRYDGLKYREIAEKLKITSSAVEKHIEKALGHCRATIATYNC